MISLLNLRYPNFYNYIKVNFSLYNTIFRVFLILIITLICGIIYWLLRELAISNNINIYLNYGIGFNPLNQSTLSRTMVYIIKFFIPLIFLIFFIFVTNKFLMSFSYLIFLNSLFLGIDKSLLIQTWMIYSRNSIVDYFNINNIFFTNIGDWFIFIGLFGITITSIWSLIIKVNKQTFIYTKYFSFVNRKIII